MSYKYFLPQLEIIDLIESLNNTSGKINGISNCNSTLSKKGKLITLCLNGIIEENDLMNEPTIKIKNNELILKSVDLRERFFIGSKFSGLKAEYKFDITEVQSKGFDNSDSKKFYSFFPTEIDKLKSFLFIIETKSNQNCTPTSIRIQIENDSYNIHQIKNDEKGFYVIESINKVSLDEYRESCFAIRQAIGFLTGYMPGGEEYLFSGAEFIYSNFTRPALKSIYIPVNSNAYSRLYNNKTLAEHYHDRLTKIPIDVVSRLAEQIKNKSELSSVIILLLEAASVQSLLIIPSVFSVIIESLSKIISEPEKGKFIPIGDKKLSEQIINELSKVIDQNSNQLTPDAILKLKRRILAINQPVIKEKLTNNEKLTLPFKKLEIKLSLEDIKAIEHRNDLLHGNILLDIDQLKTTEEINHYMAYIAGKLYTLISKLILKNAGYNGYVINYGKLWNENSVNEEYYELI